MYKEKEEKLRERERVCVVKREMKRSICTKRRKRGDRYFEERMRDKETDEIMRLASEE